VSECFSRSSATISASRSGVAFGLMSAMFIAEQLFAGELQRPRCGFVGVLDLAADGIDPEDRVRRIVHRILCELKPLLGLEPFRDIAKRDDASHDFVPRQIGVAVYSTGKLVPSLRHNTSSVTTRALPSRAVW
jgi:hypothetical protein